MNNIKLILDCIKDPKVVYAPLLLAILIGLIIFFINYKKKRGLIYIGVSFLITGLILFSIKPVVEEVILQEGLSDYLPIIDKLLTNALGGLITISYIYFVCSILFIALFIVLKIIKKKKKETSSLEEGKTI